MNTEKFSPQDNGLTPADYDEYGEEPRSYSSFTTCAPQLAG